MRWKEHLGESTGKNVLENGKEDVGDAGVNHDICNIEYSLLN